MPLKKGGGEEDVTFLVKFISYASLKVSSCTEVCFLAALREMHTPMTLFNLLAGHTEPMEH